MSCARCSKLELLELGFDSNDIQDIINGMDRLDVAEHEHSHLLTYSSLMLRELAYGQNWTPSTPPTSPMYSRKSCFCFDEVETIRNNDRLTLTPSPGDFPLLFDQPIPESTWDELNTEIWVRTPLINFIKCLAGVGLVC